MLEIPIVIHHEGYTPYLEDCVNLASASNERVLLIGNTENKHIAKEWYDSCSLEGDLWREFKENFANFSAYNDVYAEQIIKRFFLLRELMVGSNIDKCFLIDSDVLLYKNMTELNREFDGYIASLHVPYNQDGYRWVASAGCSYWTKEGIISYTDYVLDVYKNNVRIFDEKRESDSGKGGICEMTTLYLWYCQNEKKIKNTAIMLERGVLEGGMCLSEGYEKDEYIYNNWLHCKKVKFSKNIPYLKKTDGKIIQAYCLHFGGGKYVKGYIKYAVKYTLPWYAIFEVRFNNLIIKIKKYRGKKKC